MISSASRRLRRSANGDGRQRTASTARAATATAPRARPSPSRARSARRTAWRSGTPARARAGRAGTAPEPVDARAEQLDVARRAARSPHTAFMNVVLPAPFVPMRPTISPGPTSIETSSTADEPTEADARPRRCAAAAPLAAWVAAVRSRGSVATDARGVPAVAASRCAVRSHRGDRSRGRCTIDDQPVGEVHDDDQHPDARGEQPDLVRAVEDGRDAHHDERAEHRADRPTLMPPTTAIDSDEQRLARWEEARAGSWCCQRQSPRRARRCRRRCANAIELRPGRRHGERRGGALVVAHRDERPADAGPPHPRDDAEHDDQRRPGTRSSRRACRRMFQSSRLGRRSRAERRSRRCALLKRRCSRNATCRP